MLELGVVGALLIAVGCIVAVCVQLLRRGRVYRKLPAESRPRRWVIALMLTYLLIFCGWFPIWLIWPHAFISRALLLLLGLATLVVGVTARFHRFVDYTIEESHRLRNTPKWFSSSVALASRSAMYVVT